MRSYLIAFISVVVACGGKPSPESTTTPPATTAAQLELGEITVFDGPNAMFKIHANGTTEMGAHKGGMEIKPGQTASTDSLPIVWEAGPTLHADGTIDAKGAPVAKLNADGSIMELKTNTALPVKVADDKVTIIDSKGTSVSAQLGGDGKLTFINAPDPGHVPQIRVEGADTLGKRRTVLAILGVMFAPGEVTIESSGPASIEAPATAEPTKR